MSQTGGAALSLGSTAYAIVLPLRVLSFLFFTWSCGKSLLSL